MCHILLENPKNRTISSIFHSNLILVELLSVGRRLFLKDPPIFIAGQIQACGKGRNQRIFSKQPPPYCPGSQAVPQAFLGHFLGGANHFFLPKLNPVLPKKYPLWGGQILQFCSAKLMYHSFVSNCSASLHIGKKLLNDALKRGKNRREIGKYKAETKQKLLKTGKLGRKN